MSAHTVARWNAIPLDRGENTSPSLKRARPDEEDGDDDDVSLVSRSPSPPDDAMDVDESGIHKYDEYVRGAVREVITVETKIKPTNKGFALLSKLGWVEGQPIGLSGEGRVDPIPFHMKSDLTGLGKSSQDFRMIEETVSQRRGLDSERQQRENEEQRRQRQDAVARKTALESEISSTLRAFYCSLCDKQFKNVAQYDEHTNSYAHHHKARFKDMQANIRIKPQEEIDKRKEKERRREQKELRKIAAANGIKMPKPVTVSNPSAVLGPVSSDASTASGSNDMEVEHSKPVEPKKSGWASISSSQGNGSGGGFTKSGWASGSSRRFAQPPSPPPPSAPPTFSTLPSETVNSTRNADHLPTFRNAGWTSLDTGSSQPPPPADEPPPPPSASASARGGWSSITSSSNLGSAPPPPPPPSDPRTMLVPPLPPSRPPSQPAAASLPENQAVRSNWQQFKQGIGKRR